MYVIGTDEWHFIKVKRKNMYDGKRVFWIIDEVIYNITNKEDCKNNSMSIIKSNFTIFDDLKYTKETLSEIKNNKYEIRFENNHMIESIINKENNKKFDVNTLKMYELVPTEITESEE